MQLGYANVRFNTDSGDLTGPPGTTPPGVLSIGARGCFANHACYAWADGGRSYRVSLHAWRPPAQTLAVFARVVRSIPGR